MPNTIHEAEEKSIASPVSETDQYPNIIPPFPTTHGVVPSGGGNTNQFEVPLLLFWHVASVACFTIPHFLNKINTS